MSLPEDYRMVIILRELNGLSYSEIEGFLNISQGTVKSRISRARQALREKILSDGEQYPEILRLLGERRAK